MSIRSGAFLCARQRLAALTVFITLLVATGSQATPAVATELSSPAAASWGPSRFDLVVRGEDGLIYHKYWNNGAGPVNGWTDWGPIGAPPVGAASSPTVSAPAPNILQVFVRGGDNQIWNNHWTYSQGSAPGGWSGWGAVPNTGNATWAPSATYGKDNQPDVFYTGNNGAIYYTRFDTSLGWVPPVSLGGTIWGSPAATTTAGGRMQLAVRGSDNRVYNNWADTPSSWLPWGIMPGAYTSMSPTASTGEEGQFQTFFRDINNGFMYHQYWNPTTGWVGPGQIPDVELVSSPAAARLHVYYRNSAGNVLGTHYDPLVGWVAPSSKGQPNSDGRLYREQSSPAVYWIMDGSRYWVTSPEVASAAGMNLANVELLPNGSLDAMPRGENITMATLAEWLELDPGTAEAAGNGWKNHGEDHFEFFSDDGRAKATGSLKWFHGRFPFGYRHRAAFSPTSWVAPQGAVGCIWAKVKWEKITLSSVSFPPGGSIGGASVDSNYFVKCRKPPWGAPDAMSLWGLGEAGGWLEWAYLTICTSNTRAEGPKHCSNDKFWY